MASRNQRVPLRHQSNGANARKSKWMLVLLSGAKGVKNATFNFTQQASKTVTPVRYGHSGSFVQPKFQKRRKEHKKRLGQGSLERPQ